MLVYITSQCSRLLVRSRTMQRGEWCSLISPRISRFHSNYQEIRAHASRWHGLYRTPGAGETAWDRTPFESHKLYGIRTRGLRRGYALHLPKLILSLQFPLTLGALVLIHGSVLHKSERNQSSNTRYAYTFHMIEGAPGVASWDEKNWLQPTVEVPFSPLFASP